MGKHQTVFKLLMQVSDSSSLSLSCDSVCICTYQNGVTIPPDIPENSGYTVGIPNILESLEKSQTVE